MNAWPDAPPVRAFLERAWNRLAVIAALRGATMGLVAATMWVALVWWFGWRPSLMVAGTVIAVALGIAAAVRAVRRRDVPVHVEQRAPECRNLLITAAELVDAPARVKSAMGALVCREASTVIGRLDLARLFPLTRAVIACAVLVAAWTSATAAAWTRPHGPSTSATAAASPAPSIADVRIDVTPPAYTDLPSQSLQDPARVQVLAGSRLHVSVSGSAASVTLETAGGRMTLGREGERFGGDLVADADGYLALEPVGTDGASGPRRLLGLDVQPDRPPVVRVVKPGHDLFVSNDKIRLALGIEAQDDLALASLKLTYTKVSGTGENLTFAEGELPLRLTRTNDRSWTADGELSLAAFGLIPGDMLVYRGVAADKRPGATPVESDAFIVSMMSPGDVAADGFAVDDERDRYALSQQMIILKTERLSARRPAMTADSVAEEALNIAAEQRRVRAEFIFMMGGELADESISGGDLDETTEAMGEADLLAGRAQNQGRRDLILATRSMSEAAMVLAAPDLPTALKAERAALAALQRAFSKNRYILRTLTQRESLDLARRLTGKFTEVASGVRAVAEVPVDPRLAALRRALSDVAALAGRLPDATGASAEAMALAQSVLRIDPASEPLRQVSSRLSEASTALGGGRPSEVAGLLDSAASGLVGAMSSSLDAAPHPALTPAGARLNGALADALAAGKVKR